MEIMYHRKTGMRYEVHGFDVDHGTALCYDTNQAARCNGQGWIKIPTKFLIPEAYANKITGEFMSKTERADIKHHLKLVEAIWECEDGSQFDHAHIDDAIEHQRKLMQNDLS